MKKYLKLFLFIGLFTVMATGCGKKETVDIYYTTDLHSHFTKNLEKYLEKRNRMDSVLVDAGDIIDIQTEDDKEWSSGEKTYGVISEFNAMVKEKVSEPSEGMPPVGKKMEKYGYDMAAIGNHEFYESFKNLQSLLDKYKKAGVPLMSANTYYTEEYSGNGSDRRVSFLFIQV